MINTNRPETFGIATQLTKHAAKIPPKESYKLQSWIKNWVYKTNIRNKSWTFGWGAYWNMMPTIENVDLALKWIEVCPENINGATWIIKELFRANRYDVNTRIKKWYSNHPNHPVSKIINKKLRI
jgi:hypothetical protein